MVIRGRSSVQNIGIVGFSLQVIMKERKMMLSSGRNGTSGRLVSNLSLQVLLVTFYHAEEVRCQQLDLKFYHMHCLFISWICGHRFFWSTLAVHTALLLMHLRTRSCYQISLLANRNADVSGWNYEIPREDLDARFCMHMEIQG